MGKPRACVWRYANRDGSITFGLRRMEAGRDVRVTVLRTEPKPTKPSIREWERQVRQRAADLNAQDKPLRAQAADWPIERALSEFLAWGGQRLAAGTMENLGHDCGQFLAHLKRPAILMRDVPQFDVAAWRDALTIQGLQPSTVNRYLASLSSWWSWACDYGLVAENICRKVRKLPGGNGHALIPIRTGDDLRERLALLSNDRPRAVMVALACTGLRQGEFKQLRTEHVHAEYIVIDMPAGERTKHHNRWIPLPSQGQEAFAWLLEHRSEGPFACNNERGGALAAQINRWLEPALITPHDLRRFYQTALEGLGAPKTIIDDLMGHVDRVRRAYTCPSGPEALARAVPWIEKFNAWLGPTA